MKNNAQTEPTDYQQEYFREKVGRSRTYTKIAWFLIGLAALYLMVAGDVPNLIYSIEFIVFGVVGLFAALVVADWGMKKINQKRRTR